MPPDYALTLALVCVGGGAIDTLLPFFDTLLPVLDTPLTF